MVDFVFKTRKQYWSAIKNVQKNIRSESPEGIKARKAMYQLTGNKIYKENIYQRNAIKGQIPKIKDVRNDFKKLKEEAEQKIHTQWLENKNSKDNQFKSFKEFRLKNTQPDYAEIYESYNSPK